MTRNVFLLGIGHEYQHNSTLYKRISSEAIDEFKRYISKEHGRYNFKAIGEELHRSELKKDRDSSVPEEVAEKLGIEHKYCNNGPEDAIDLEKMGYKETLIKEKKGSILKPRYESDEDWLLRNMENEAIREFIWIKKILECDQWPLLFICGSDHVGSFSTKLQTEGINVTLLNKNWISSYAL